MKKLKNEIMEEIKYLPFLYASMGCIVALAMIILKFFTIIILVIGSGLILLFLVMLAALLIHKLRHIELLLNELPPTEVKLL
jgi:Flp pilus assembly protein TadB